MTKSTKEFLNSIIPEDIEWIIKEDEINKLDNKLKKEVEKGKFFFLKEKYEESLKIFEELYKKYPNNKIVLKGILLLYCSLDIDKAKKLLKKINEDKKIYKYLEGIIYESEGEIQYSLKNYQEIVQEEDFLPALFRLAYYYDLYGNEVEAEYLYKKCLKIKPTYTNILINLGIIYEDNEEYYKAIECYEKVLEYEDNKRAKLFLKDALASLSMKVDEEREKKDDELNKILATPISEFELSVRSKNCLNKMNIKTLGELIKKTEAELLAYKNFGETSLKEIKNMLASKGLRLGMGREEKTKRRERKRRENKTQKLERENIEKPNAKKEEKENILSKSILELKVNLRTQKCLESLGIKKIGDLLKINEKDLLKCKNFGQTSMEELKNELEKYGLKIPS